VLRRVFNGSRNRDVHIENWNWKQFIKSAVLALYI
jgi:hypothetical protein